MAGEGAPPAAFASSTHPCHGGHENYFEELAVPLHESDGKHDVEASERLRPRRHIQQITPLDASSFPPSRKTIPAGVSRAADLAG
jgi:hypothetical protein